MKQSLITAPAGCHLMCLSLQAHSSLLFLVLAGVCRAGAGLDTWHWDICGSCPPKMCRHSKLCFPSSYVTTSSGEHFLDLFLSCCCSELIPELTFGTCSEISALQVCLGSPQRLLSCARWCRNNLCIVSGLVVTPHPQSSSAFAFWGTSPWSVIVRKPKAAADGYSATHTGKDSLG